MNILEKCAKRKAERGVTSAEKLEIQRRRKAVEMTTQLIAEITVDANIRSALIPMDKKK